MDRAGKGPHVPTEFADRWELIVSEAGKRLFERRNRIKQAVGARPFKGLPVSEDELLGRYGQIRRDPEEMLKLLLENVKVAKDGRVLLPKEFVNKLVEMEGKIKDGGYR